MLQIVFVFLCCKMFAGREAHVMTFEVGDALEDAKWQAHVCTASTAKNGKDFPWHFERK
jgi:hypothetical protein